MNFPVYEKPTHGDKSTTTITTLFTKVKPSWSSHFLRVPPHNTVRMAVTFQQEFGRNNSNQSILCLSPKCISFSHTKHFHSIPVVPKVIPASTQSPESHLDQIQGTFKAPFILRQIPSNCEPVKSEQIFYFQNTMVGDK